MQVISFGFNTADERVLFLEVIKINQRNLTEHFSKGQLSASIADSWVPHLSSTVHIQFRVDSEIFSDQVTLSEGSEVFCALRAYSPGVSKQFATHAKPLKFGSQSLDLELAPFSISERLDLFLEFFVKVKPEAAVKIGAPVRSFSNIFQKRFSIDIGGDESQLNIHFADFSALREMKSALWKIEIDLPADPDDWLLLEIGRVLTVKLNSAFPEELFTLPEINTLMLSEIYYLIISKFMSSEESRELIEQKSINVGSWINLGRSISQLAFGQSLDIRGTWQGNKEEILARLQNHVYPLVQNRVENLQKLKAGIE